MICNKPRQIQSTRRGARGVEGNRQEYLRRHRDWQIVIRTTPSIAKNIYKLFPLVILSEAKNLGSIFARAIETDQRCFASLNMTAAFIK